MLACLGNATSATSLQLFQEQQQMPLISPRSKHTTEHKWVDGDRGTILCSQVGSSFRLHACEEGIVLGGGGVHCSSCSHAMPYVASRTRSLPSSKTLGERRSGFPPGVMHRPDPESSLTSVSRHLNGVFRSYARSTRELGMVPCEFQSGCPGAFALAFYGALPVLREVALRPATSHGITVLILVHHNGTSQVATTCDPPS